MPDDEDVLDWEYCPPEPPPHRVRAILVRFEPSARLRPALFAERGDAEQARREDERLLAEFSWLRWAALGEALPMPELRDLRPMTPETKARLGFPYNVPTGADEEC